MAEVHEWLQVELDTNHRRGLAEMIEANSDSGNEARGTLLRMLRSSRNELLLDQQQAQVVLAALNADHTMLSALRARLEAFLADQ